MKMLGVFVAVLASVMVASQWKDIARYAKMHRMSAGKTVIADGSD